MTRRALISVYFKDGILDLASALIGLGFEIVSSGGTHDKLKDAGIPVLSVESVTGFPEMLDGRVKTMHPMILAGVLADRSKPKHMAKLTEHGIVPIDLVVCNLYPFTSDPSIELIDIGGPTMVRSAAKNHAGVGIVVDPADYASIIAELTEHNELSDATRLKLARKAFAHTAAYDASIVPWFDEQLEAELPETVHITATLQSQCRYGENAWQSPAGLYVTGDKDELGLGQLTVVEGATPSFNNDGDIDRAQQTLTHAVAAFERFGLASQQIAIGVKHGNPCGASFGTDSVEVMRKMAQGDSRSLFGGVVVTNFVVGEDEVEALKAHQPTLDGIVAPAFTSEAISLLKRKTEKCRFITNPALAHLTSASLDRTKRFKYVRGGLLSQPNYTFVLDYDGDGFEWVYGPPDRQKQIEGLFAWAIGSTSNSNTITLVRDQMLIGNGVGQQDRVGCCELAIKRAFDAGHNIDGAVAYSDSFFPFEDGPLALLNAGVRLIITTNGSRNDGKVVEELLMGAKLGWLNDGLGRGFFGH